MRPAKLTQEIKQKILDNIAETLDKQEITSTEVKVSFSLDQKSEEKMKIMYTPEAYLKCYSLVKEFSTEIGWHMLIDKVDDMTYVITDVMVYPQTVSGANIDTDIMEYHTWRDSYYDTLSENEPSKMLAQAHSHVNMSTSPSTKDYDTWREVALNDNSLKYYLFQIWNKQGDINSFFYDMEHNIMYTKDDIELHILSSSGTMNDFVEESAAMVKTIVRTVPKAENKYPENNVQNGWNYNQGYCYGANYDKSWYSTYNSHNFREDY